MRLIGNMRWNYFQYDAADRSCQRPPLVRQPIRPIAPKPSPWQASLAGLVIMGATLLMALPAQAAKLQSYRFDAGRNQLEFTTDEGVQPKAQLIENPTRLVIDLPGVTFGKPQTSLPVNSKSIRSVRVGQFEKGTARIVIELEPGFTLDANAIQFRGVSPRQWTVTLPQPQAVIGVPTPPPGSTDPGTSVPTQPIPDTAQTQIQNARVTGDGFFIRTSGNAPQIRVNRSRDRRLIDIDLLGASISPSLTPRDFVANHKGVGRVQITQPSGTPPIARITLSVEPNAPDWQASYSNQANGVVLLPGSGGSTASTEPPKSEPNKLTTIQVVELDNREQQLLIAGDQPLGYTAGWDRGAGVYKVTINNAQLGKNLKGPSLNANSPLLQVRLRQETPKTVAILISPSSGVQIASPISTSRQSIALQLNRSSRPPVTFPIDGTIVPVPPTLPGPGLPPRNPIGRGVVIIDPGHGGPDPGAIGVGGIQEKEIVLDISRQVTAILAQNGIQAIMTRDSDIDLDLAPRVSMAERARASVFVSIHANAISLSRPDVNGLETYYYSSGADLARLIHQNVLGNASIADRSIRKGRFYVLRNTSMPSVLVETGFVTGATDAANFNNPAHRRQIAEGIARGIIQYLRGG
jgi:N-acetylmuramoyl-L-alanine amidase